MKTLLDKKAKANTAMSPGPTCGLTLGPQAMPGDAMECGPMGELMTEKGEPRPFIGELSVLMGE